MIRSFILRVLAVLACLIARAQNALGTVEVEILHEGVAIADNVTAAFGAIVRLERSLALKLQQMGLARVL